MGVVFDAPQNFWFLNMFAGLLFTWPEAKTLAQASSLMLLEVWLHLAAHDKTPQCWMNLQGKVVEHERRASNKYSTVDMICTSCMNIIN